MRQPAGGCQLGLCPLPRGFFAPRSPPETTGNIGSYAGISSADERVGAAAWKGRCSHQGARARAGGPVRRRPEAALVAPPESEAIAIAQIPA